MGHFSVRAGHEWSFAVLSGAVWVRGLPTRIMRPLGLWKDHGKLAGRYSDLRRLLRSSCGQSRAGKESFTFLNSVLLGSPMRPA